MDIHPIGKRNLLIYLNSEELSALPEPLSELKTDAAAGILREALGEGCRGEWRNVYLELFEGKDSVLLVARAHSGNPYFFKFQDIEEVIAAAATCPDDLISFLSYCGGSYYLVVYPWDREPLSSALFEYGEALSLHANYTLHLTEHGKMLMGPSALDELREWF